MKILIIGGSVFLGRHLVSEALAAGHKVTTLNRGNHALLDQANVERVIADRRSLGRVLAGRCFDAVIDTCAYNPEAVLNSASALEGRVEKYLFVSSISAYSTFTICGITEEHPAKYTQDGQSGDYGTLKADCEKALIERLADRALVVRPGLIVGPYDQTDRFTYWPARIAKGGKVLAPGRPERAVQFIDGRDLAAWMVKLVERGARGIYNATGPYQRLTMQAFLNASVEAVGSNCELVWLDDSVLSECEVGAWMEMPLWIPETQRSYRGFMEFDCRKALSSGLKFRSLAESVRDTLSWDSARKGEIERKAGMSAEKELDIFKRYRLPRNR